MAEALNGTFKAELVSLHGPWRTRSQLEIAVIEWIDWYNASRLSLGSSSRRVTLHAAGSRASAQRFSRVSCTHRPAPHRFKSTPLWHRRRLTRCRATSVVHVGFSSQAHVQVFERDRAGSLGRPRPENRLHGEISDRPPVEHEADWYRQHDLAITAGTPITHTA
jgi:hypothetical protein